MGLAFPKGSQLCSRTLLHALYRTAVHVSSDSRPTAQPYLRFAYPAAVR